MGAASSLYLSLIVLTPEVSIPEVWSSSLEYYSEYKATDLLPTIKKLASLLSKAENAKLKAVQQVQHEATDEGVRDGLPAYRGPTGAGSNHQEYQIVPRIFLIVFAYFWERYYLILFWTSMLKPRVPFSVRSYMLKNTRYVKFLTILYILYKC